MRITATVNGECIEADDVRESENRLASINSLEPGRTARDLAERS
jgi:hypothetical protein